MDNEKLCESFNQLYPVGSKVVYVDDLGQHIETTVKYPARVLSGHAPVVWLNGVSDCYDLRRVITKQAHLSKVD